MIPRCRDRERRRGQNTSTPLPPCPGSTTPVLSQAEWRPPRPSSRVPARKPAAVLACHFDRKRPLPAPCQPPPVQIQISRQSFSSCRPARGFQGSLAAVRRWFVPDQESAFPAVPPRRETSS